MYFGERMVNVQRAERCKRKMAFSLKVKKYQRNGFGIETVSPGHQTGSFQDKGGLELVLPIMGQRS